MTPTEPDDATKTKMVQIAVRDGISLAEQLTGESRSPIMACVTLANATALTYGTIAEIVSVEEADRWLGVFLEGLSDTLDKLGHPIIAGFTRIPDPGGAKGGKL